ncbi:MAG: class I SAM-dependent methyltransferase [Rhodobacteraceae bacterium]|nr:class I SAM-dependent methyltransferase [Paracoccaceae bacterium]
MKELLHVGCGPKTIKHLPGFFRTGWRESRLDIDPGVSPDILASLTDLSGIESDRFDGLWSSHNIEHVFPHEAAGVCQDFRRVLRPDGFAVITCPDIRVPLQAALKDGLDAAICQSGMGPISARDILFGHQASIAAGNAFMAHRNGFDLTSLRDVLQQAGFRRIVGKRVGRNLWFIAGGFDSNETARARLEDILAQAE